MKCNQCGEELRTHSAYRDSTGVVGFLYICINPKCPNYSLLQIPIELMEEYK
jgi:hypothetical protein